MTVERISVTLPPDLVADARSAVAAGAADSMSAFVADAMRSQLRRDRDLAALAQVLGGPPPREVIDVVRRDLGLPPEPTQ
jgi:antitoxin ParD1/3/4